MKFCCQKWVHFSSPSAAYPVETKQFSPLHPHLWAIAYRITFTIIGRLFVSRKAQFHFKKRPKLANLLWLIRAERTTIGEFADETIIDENGVVHLEKSPLKLLRNCRIFCNKIRWFCALCETCRRSLSRHSALLVSQVRGSVECRTYRRTRWATWKKFELIKRDRISGGIVSCVRDLLQLSQTFSEFVNLKFGGNAAAAQVQAALGNLPEAGA